MPETHTGFSRTVARATAGQLQELASLAIDASGVIMAALMLARDADAHRLADTLYARGDVVASEIDCRNVSRADLLALVEVQEQGATWLHDHRRQFLS